MKVIPVLPLLLLAALVADPSLLADAGAAFPLQGSYTAVADGADDGLTRQFEISGAHGERFKIRGVGQAWTGTGSIRGTRGHYEWRLGGEGHITGRTTFEVGKDGKLHGETRSSGGQLIWKFVADRAEGPIRPITSRDRTQPK
jgi:hypothetical protein